MVLPLVEKVQGTFRQVNAYQYLDLYIKILQNTQLTLDERFSKLETYTPDEKKAAEEALSALLIQLRKRTKELEEKC